MKKLVETPEQLKKRESREKARLANRRLAMLKAHNATLELNTALQVLKIDDPEATILFKRAINQVQLASNYLR